MEGLAELACRPGRWVLPSVLVRGRHVLVEGGQEGCIRTTFVASSTTSLALLPLSGARPTSPIRRRSRWRVAWLLEMGPKTALWVGHVRIQLRVGTCVRHPVRTRGGRTTTCLGSVGKPVNLMVDLVVAAGQGGQPVHMHMDAGPERPLVDGLGAGHQAGGRLLLVLVLPVLGSWWGTFFRSVPSLANDHHRDHYHQGHQGRRNHRHDQNHFCVRDVSGDPDPLDVDLAGDPEPDVVGDEAEVGAEALLHEAEGDGAGEVVTADLPLITPVAFLPMVIHVGGVCISLTRQHDLVLNLRVSTLMAIEWILMETMVMLVFKLYCLTFSWCMAHSGLYITSIRV